MEHFKVTFDPNDIRDVLLDGKRIGPTETVLMTETNFYNVSLSGPLNYTPHSRGEVINGTTSEHPLVITFNRQP